jgi:hypothetical protein
MSDKVAGPDGSALSEGLGAWQPIETAPRDGTAVLCFRLLRGQPDIATASWKDYAEAFGGPGWTYAEGRHAPTHWMPMPAPPRSA